MPATTGLYFLGIVLLLLSASCQRQLNQRNGRYYSARDMVRIKRGERVTTRPGSRPASRPALAKSKVKTSVPSGSGTVVAKSVTKRPARMGNATGALASVIENARAYYGVPYLFGGTTRLGMDCSALLQLSFADAGIDIPRSSNEQAAWGEPVKPTELRPGDFLFFGASPGSPIITHVGMVTVVDSEGVEFIHASTSLGVTENSFELDYYLSRFIRAVRPRL
ncbi:C40 family peptidase [Hymenobacter setariae]|uniref:C40 family peptidase n=1 Tax=Hymenobacter setariae TaxID=2594794 RepID=UPI001F246059|nr:C40 family peptidase [Hymenobacter setariae]